METVKAGRAALLGSALWAFGLVSGILGELEWRNTIADNPIPDGLTAVAVAAGSLMLLYGLRSFNRTLSADLRLIGRAGYWIAFSGLAITVAPVWPFIVIGPFVAGIGLTLYGAERAKLRSEASVGAWMHVACFPAGVLVGVIAVSLGYDGGIGVIGSVAIMIGGLAAMGLRLVRRDRAGVFPTPAAG